MIGTINVKASDDVVISGNSVYRKSATEAYINFISNADGTIYYTVDENPSTTIEDIVLGESSGDITKNETITINVLSNLLSSGAKYVHMVLKDDLNNYSNILTISMPNDVYYFDDFEAYSINSYPEFFEIKHNGSDSSLQEIIDLDGNKVFNGYGTYGKGLDERVEINSLSTGYVILEADISTSEIPSEWYFGGIILGEDYNSDDRNIDISVNPTSKKIGANNLSGVKHTSDIVFENNTNYNVKIVVDVANKKYDYYIDGIKANSEPINASPSFTELTWFGIYNGARTVHYDNIKFYSQSINPNIHSITKGTETNGTFTIDKDEAVPEEVITIIPSPSDGYRVKSVKVNDSTDGITKNGDTYVFTMPNEEVTVLVEFELVPTTLTWATDSIADGATGTGAEATFYVAQRFTTNDLVDYDGKKLVKVSFYTGIVEASYKVMIWDGGYCSGDNYYEGSVVYEHASVTAGGNCELKEVNIDPITINASRELWIGYEVTTPSSFPVGVDNGPANVGKGDLLNLDGQWKSICNSSHLNCNIAIFGTVISGRKHEVTVSRLTNGSIALVPSEATAGETVIITPVILEGYRVKSVKINDSAENVIKSGDYYTFTMPDEDAVVLVEFEKITKTITIREMQNGTVIVSNLIVPVGEAVTLTVTPNSGYKLKNISILDMYDDMPVDIDSNYTFIMPNYNVFVYAEFSKISTSQRTTTSYRITVEKGDNGDISPNTISVTKNKDKKFTITPDEGYEIEDVLVDGETVGAVSTYTFEKITKKHTIKAIFKKIEETSVATKNYKDVFEKDWYYDSVIYVTEKGIMKGVGGDLFDPTAKVTRAMMVTALYNLENRPSVLKNNSFKDVNPEMWYANSIAWAKESKIVNGFEDGTFGPEKEITREQMSMIVMNYIDYKKIEKPLELSELKFEDSSQISSWAKDSVKLVKEMKIMQGKDNNMFDALGAVTRAELAMMIMNFCVEVEND